MGVSAPALVICSTIVIISVGGICAVLTLSPLTGWVIPNREGGWKVSHTA